jgi:hypothetical protein
MSKHQERPLGNALWGVGRIATEHADTNKQAYLLKDLSREQLVDCIRKVHRGDTCITPTVVERLAAGLSNEPLTGRELDVLTMLANGMSNRISQELIPGPQRFDKGKVQLSMLPGTGPPCLLSYVIFRFLKCGHLAWLKSEMELCA